MKASENFHGMMTDDMYGNSYFLEPNGPKHLPKMRSCSSNPGSANLFQLRTPLGLEMGSPNSAKTNREIYQEELVLPARVITYIILHDTT